MKFDEDVWKNQLIPFIDKSFELGKEIAAQLCRVDGKVQLGKRFYGEKGRVEYKISEMLTCDKGEFVGDIHVETVPHEPLFPSDDDIENEWNNVRFEKIKVPWESCLCSRMRQRRKDNPDISRELHGCYCERWHPWNKEQNEKIIEKAMPYVHLIAKSEPPGSLDPKRVGFWYLWEDLQDFGFITDRQLQWSITVSHKFPRGTTKRNQVAADHKMLDRKDGMETLYALHRTMTGTEWRGLEKH